MSSVAFRFAAAIVLLAVTFPAGPGVLAQSEPPSEQLRALYFAGKIEEAEAGALARLKEVPDDTDTMVVLANCYRSRAVALYPGGETGLVPAPPEAAGFFDKAISQIRAALRVSPDRTDIWLGLCQIERESGNFEGLLAATSEAAARFPDDVSFAAALRENVRPFLERQDWDSMARLLAAIQEHNTVDLDTLLSLGRSLYLSGKKAEGIAVIDRAVSFQDENAEAHVQRGDLAVFEGDYRMAAIHYARAGNLDSLNGSTYISHVAALHAVDRLAGLRAARAALNVWNTRKDSMQTGLVRGLLSDLRAILENPRPSPDDILRVTRTLAGADMLAAALAELSVLHALDPDSVDGAFLTAEVRGRIGQHELAAEALEKGLAALDLHPDRASGVSKDELLAALGNERFRLGDYMAAVKAYGGLSSSDDYALQIGLAYDRLGRLDDAARQFRRVVETSSDAAKLAQAKQYLESAPYRNIR